MVLTLWLYGYTQGVTAARPLAELTRTAPAYRWIVGNLHISHDKLSEFRAEHGEAFSGLLTAILTHLQERDFLKLDVVGRDGTRTRAAASAASWRSYGALLERRRQAQLQLKAVEFLASENDPEYTLAQHIRRKAAAQEYLQRIEAALEVSRQLHAERKPAVEKERARARAARGDAHGKAEIALIRVSTTDPEARVMKMPDAGYRPAYNVGYSVSGSPLGGPRTIVGVNVTNIGSDMKELEPAVEEIKRRTGQLPKAVLADANHAQHQGIAALMKQDVKALVSPPKGTLPMEKLEALRKKAPEVAAWRELMRTPEARELFRARAGLSELMNAHQKGIHKLRQFVVRGLEKVTAAVLLGALAFNLVQHRNHWFAPLKAAGNGTLAAAAPPLAGRLPEGRFSDRP